MGGSGKEGRKGGREAKHPAAKIMLPTTSPTGRADQEKGSGWVGGMISDPFVSFPHSRGLRWTLYRILLRRHTKSLSSAPQIGVYEGSADLTASGMDRIRI